MILPLLPLELCIKFHTRSYQIKLFESENLDLEISYLLILLPPGVCFDQVLSGSLLSYPGILRLFLPIGIANTGLFVSTTPSYLQTSFQQGKTVFCHTAIFRRTCILIPCCKYYKKTSFRYFLSLSCFLQQVPSFVRIFLGNS